MQSSEPEIKLIAYWEAPKTIENQLHKVFMEKKLRGEWFELDFKDLKWIKGEMNHYS